MDEFKISQTDIDNNNVKSASDLLKGDPKENKGIFDRLPELIAARFNSFVEKVIADFTGYYTKEEIDSKDAALADSIATKAGADSVYTKSEIDTQMDAVYADCATKVHVEALYSALSGRIEQKANAANVYTKTETYTKSEVDAKNNGLANTLTYSLNQKADAYNVYTRAETDSAIAEAVAGADSGAVSDIATVSGSLTTKDEDGILRGTVELTYDEIMEHINNGKTVMLSVKDETRASAPTYMAHYDGDSSAGFSSVLQDPVAVFFFYAGVSGLLQTFVVDTAGNVTCTETFHYSVPKGKSEDEGKFLRCSDTGRPEWQTVESAEGVGF